MDSESGRSRQAEGAVQDKLLGAIGGGMVLLAVLLLLFGGASDGEGEVAGGDPPQIRLIAPQGGESIEPPLSIQFTTEAGITRQPGGWGADGYHLHAEVNGRELMPGPGDISRESGRIYRWILQDLPAGEVSFRLYWSDERHAPVPVGGSEAIQIRVR